MNFITHVEDFSNEIFYKIFEFIEIFDLFKAFSNLNSRFTKLLDHRSLRFQVILNLHANHNIDLLRFYQSQIVSLRLKDHNQFLSISDLSFKNLQILILDEIPLKKFVFTFPKLTKLSRLLSLKLHFHHSIIDLTEIYTLIFQLSQLKKLTITSQGHLLALQLPLNILKKNNHLEKLILKHTCSFNDLIVLLSHTSNVHQLSCLEITRTGDELQRDFPMKTMHLTRIFFSMCKLPFDQLEIFLDHFGRQLEIFHIETSDDENYLNADRWQRIICQITSRLKQFQFRYHEWHYQNFQLTSNHQSIVKFTSQFWIDRQWTFEIDTDFNYWPPIRIIYSIEPVRYNQLKSTDKINLTINNLYYSLNREDLVNDCFCFLNRFYITNLYINCKKIIYKKLIELLSLLPNLNLLGINDISLFEPMNLYGKNFEQITRLIVENFIDGCDLIKITNFIDLCPHLSYFEIKCEKIYNVHSIIRYVLDKQINLNVFCLRVPTVDDDLIKELKLICNCKILRFTDRIYLKMLNK